MLAELERPCSSCLLLDDLVEEPTPEQELQGLRALLTACEHNIEGWVEDYRHTHPTADLAEAVAHTRAHILGIVTTTLQSRAQDAVTPIQAGTPTGCYNQYMACINGGGGAQYCFTQYELCLSNSPAG